MALATSFRNAVYGPQGYAEILRVGFPLVISMGTTSIMQFTDRIFLSHYSQEAIAAAMPASLVLMTCLLTLLGICSYSSVLIAQYVGSEALKRVGSALWQGIWCALFFALLLGSLYFVAEPLFAFAGHEPIVQKYEVKYFKILTLGAGLALLDSALGSFFYGRGRNRVVMWAYLSAAIIKIPLDYILIFGAFGIIPSLGIEGAALGTVIAWLTSFTILSSFIFTKKNERKYNVLSGWRPEWKMFKRLICFGLPSGFNLFIEMIAFTWLVFEIGALGTIALAANNIAFSINDLAFVPMLGLNMAVAMLVGQSMGRGKPKEAERYAYRTLHLALLYMVPLCVLFIAIPEKLFGLYIPDSLEAAEAAPLMKTGVTLLVYVAIYTLVDSFGIIFFGALRGAGDTIGLMMLLLCGFTFFLALPIVAIKYFNMVSLHAYWIIVTVYIITLAMGAFYRFRRKGWHKIRVVETTKRIEI